MQLEKYYRERKKELLKQRFRISKDFKPEYFDSTVRETTDKGE